MLGIVMMKMIRSTNMTSISGVILMSEYDWPSPPPPTLMAMRALLQSGTEMIGCGYERHFANTDLLGRHEHLPHILIPNVRIAANMDFGLRLHARNAAQQRFQRILVRHRLGVPEYSTLLFDGYPVVFRLGLRRQIGRLRQLHRHLLDDDPNSNDENDQEHQHHVH